MVEWTGTGVVYWFKIAVVYDIIQWPSFLTFSHCHLRHPPAWNCMTFDLQPAHSNMLTIGNSIWIFSACCSSINSVLCAQCCCCCYTAWICMHLSNANDKMHVVYIVTHNPHIGVHKYPRTMNELFWIELTRSLDWSHLLFPIISMKNILQWQGIHCPRKLPCSTPYK